MALMVKNVFDWDYFNLYLCGPIDFDKFARDWRQSWIKKLTKIGIKPNQIFNPCKKPLSGAPFNLDNEGELMNARRAEKDWGGLCEIMSHIVHIDLRMVEKSDLILVNFPKAGQERYRELTKMFDAAFQDAAHFSHSDESDEAIQQMKTAYYKLLLEISAHRVPTYGTVHEIVHARDHRKPVLVVWEGGKEKCSAWIMWLVGQENVFGTVDEMVAKMDSISKGRVAYNARDWLLLDLGRMNDVYNKTEKEN